MKSGMAWGPVRPSFSDWAFLLYTRDRMLEDKGIGAYVGVWG